MITRNEFITFVESFNKKPGEFTKDEIYEIGLKHKEIAPMSDRSWDLVKYMVGWEGSKDSLRMFINDQQKKEQNFITVGEDVIDDNVFESEMNKLYIEKTKMRDMRNSVTRGLREEARIQALKEIIQEEASKLPELPKVNSPRIITLGNTEAILMLSDLHIGVDCKNFYNTYNTNVAAKRLSKLASDVIEYCQCMNVQKLNVVNLGDLIHGLIHTNARIEAQIDVISQVMTAAELLSQFMNKVSEAAPDVTYRSCSDNHARTIANKAEAIENENFGRLIDWFLKERLKDTCIEFCEDNIDCSLGKFTLMNGKKVMFAHGHQDLVNKSFQGFIGASREFIDIGLLAHYHSGREKIFNGFRVFVNGSIVGTEEYALSKRLFSTPEQKLLIFEGDNILDFNINLDVK